MIYRLLGRTKLNVSLLSYGCGGARRMGIALGFSLQKQQELINRCIDLGINFFDTSADYGSEESLGKCLNQFSRDSYYLSTKWNPKTPDSKIKSPLDLEKSVALYEKGIELKNICEEKLKKVELQIKKIKLENNKIIKEEFK